MTYTPKFPKPGKKKKKSIPKAKNPEKDLQIWAENYLMARGVSFIRLPDALLRSVFTSATIPPHQKKIISSYLAGLADLTIFHPTLKIGKYPIVLSLELKTESGRTSKKQDRYLDRVQGIVAKGWDEIKAEIDSFLDYEK